MHARPLSYLRLQMRLLQLALCNRWLATSDVAGSYDQLAPAYDAAWLAHLTPVTDRLLSATPHGINGHIIDLGCGTGYSSAWLAQHNPAARISLVDCSPAMLAHARQRVCAPRATPVCADMLSFLRAQPPRSAQLVFSAWAIGYSIPAQIIREAGRVLAPGGTLAFVVNSAGTLRPVFLAFWQCMLAYPAAVRKTLHHHFPRRWSTLAHALRRAHIAVAWQQHGAQPIAHHVPPGQPLLPWLLHTGILAGFDRVLPLGEPGPVADYFESLLQPQRDAITHCYFSAMGVRQ